MEGREVECVDPFVARRFPFDGEFGRRVEDATEVRREEEGDRGESE